MPDEPVGLEDALAEEVEVEQEPAQEDGEVDVVIEGEEQPERKPVEKAAIDAAVVDGEEDDKDLSERARARIAKLTWATKERERQLAEEQAVIESLTQYGNGAKAALENLAKQNAELQRSLQQQALRTRDAEIIAAQNDWRAARESADPDKEVAASQRMAELAQQKAMLAQYQIPEPWQPPPPPMRQQPAAITPDPVTAKWLNENRWFAEDAGMRSYAVQYSQQLANQGVAPETETYYSYINAEMRKRFPERFETGTPMSTPAKTERSANPNTSRPPVATATRTNGAVNGKRTVVMSAEKARVHREAARRFGVDFKDYVKNIPKEDL